MGGGSLTERGKQFLTPKIRGDYSATLSNNSVVDSIISSLGGKRKVTSSASGFPVYSYDSEIKGRVQIGEAIALDVNRRIANLIEEEQGMSRVEATQLVIRQLQLNNKDGKYIKIGLNSGADIQTNLSQFQPAQTIAQIRSQDTQSNQNKKVINQTQQSNQNKKVINQTQQNKKQTIVLSPSITTKQNQLLDLKKNPPSGTNKKAAATTYTNKRSRLMAELVAILTKDPSNPNLYNNQKAAEQYVDNFVNKNKI